MSIDESKRGVMQGPKSDEKQKEEAPQSQMAPHPSEPRIGASGNAASPADGAAAGDIAMLIEGQKCGDYSRATVNTKRVPIAVGSRQSGGEAETTKTHQIHLRIDQQQTTNSVMDDDLMGMSKVTKDEKSVEEKKAENKPPEKEQVIRMPAKTVGLRERRETLTRGIPAKEFIPPLTVSDQQSSSPKQDGLGGNKQVTAPTVPNMDRTEQNSTKMISTKNSVLGQHLFVDGSPRAIVGQQKVVSGKSTILASRVQLDQRVDLKPAFAGLQVQRVAIHSRGNKQRQQNRNASMTDPGRSAIATLAQQSTQINKPVIELVEIDERDTIETPRVQHFVKSKESDHVGKENGVVMQPSPSRPCKDHSITFALSNYLQSDAAKQQKSPKGGVISMGSNDLMVSEQMFNWMLEEARSSNDGGKSSVKNLNEKWVAFKKKMNTDPKYKLDSERSIGNAHTDRRSQAGMSGGTATGSISFRQMRKQQVSKFFESRQQNQGIRRLQGSLCLDNQKLGSDQEPEEQQKVFSADGSARRVNVLNSPRFSMPDDEPIMTSGSFQINSFRLATGNGPRQRNHQKHVEKIKVKTARDSQVFKSARRDLNLFSKQTDKSSLLQDNDSNTLGYFPNASHGLQNQESFKEFKPLVSLTATKGVQKHEGPSIGWQPSQDEQNQTSLTLTKHLSKKSIQSSAPNSAMPQAIKTPKQKNVFINILPQKTTKKSHAKALKEQSQQQKVKSQSSTISLPSTTSANKKPTKLKMQLEEYKRKKTMMEDEDPFGLLSDKNIQTIKKKPARQKASNTAASSSLPDAQATQGINNDKVTEMLARKRKTQQLASSQDEQWNVIDYPRHVRLTSRLEDLATTRDALRKQKFFHHKFDTKLADYTNRHLYKDVYVPNETNDPQGEKEQTTLEFIREHRPANMKKEPTINLDKQPQMHGEKSKVSETTLSKSDQIYFDKLRKYPVSLIKQFAFRNARDDNDEEAVAALPVSQKTLKNQKELLQKRQEKMLKKLNPDFETRLRLYNKGVDVEIANHTVADARKDVYVKMKGMVEETEKTVKEKYKQETKNFFEANNLESPEKSKENLALGAALLQDSESKMNLITSIGKSDASNKIVITDGKEKGQGSPDKGSPGLRPISQKTLISKRGDTSAKKSQRGATTERETRRKDLDGMKAINLIPQATLKAQTPRRGLPAQSVATNFFFLLKQDEDAQSPGSLDHKYQDENEKKHIKRLKKYLQSLGEAANSQESSEPQTPEVMKKPVASKTYSFEGSLGHRPSTINPVFNTNKMRTAFKLIEEEEKDHGIKEEEDLLSDSPLNEFSHQVKNLVHAKLALAQLDKSIRKDLIYRIVSKKPEPEEKDQDEEKADIQVRKQVKEQLAVRRMRKKLVEEGKDGLIDAMDFMNHYQQVHGDDVNFQEEIAQMSNNKPADDISQIRNGVEEKFNLINKWVTVRKNARGSGLGGEKQPASKTAPTTDRTGNPGCACHKNKKGKGGYSDLQASPTTIREDSYFENSQRYDADLCEYCRSRPSWIFDWTGDLDFKESEPEVERKLNQFIQNLFRKSIKTEPRYRDGAKKMTKKDKQDWLLQQLEELKNGKPEMRDLDNLLRLCFKEREFLRDDLKANVASQTGRIQEYNNQFMEAIVRMQENLHILQDPKTNPGAPTLDEEDYEAQFNAKQVLSDQLRGGRDNFRNFLILNSQDDGQHSQSKKEEEKVNMRRIIGNSKPKSWKPSRIEYGKALKAVLDSSENR